MPRGDLVRALARLRKTRDVSLQAMILSARQELPKSKSRLPTLSKKPQDEFAAPQQKYVDKVMRKLRRRALVRSRIASIAQPKLMSSIYGASIGLSAIFVIGGLEGRLWLAKHVEAWDGLRFSLMYALMNLLPSFTWNSVDPTVVLQALDPHIGAPDTTLYDFSLLHDSVHAADDSAAPKLIVDTVDAASPADPNGPSASSSTSEKTAGSSSRWSWLFGGGTSRGEDPPSDAALASSGSQSPETGPTHASVAEVVSSALQRAELACLASLRGILATVVVVTQLLRAFSNQLQAEESWRESTLSGKEKILPTLNGRETVLRLCGQHSETTMLALRRYGEHVLPVFENRGHVAEAMRSRSKSGQIPCWWHIKAHRYASRDSWIGMGVTEEWLLRTSTGRRILLVEADATVPLDEAGDDLTTKFTKQSEVDLDIDEAVQGFRSFEYHAKKQILKDVQARQSWLERTVTSVPMRTARVLLTDSSQYLRVGGEDTQTVRERLVDRGDVDIVLDSTMPILDALVHWCKRITAPQLKRLREAREEDPWMQFGEDHKPKVVFETALDDNFLTIKDFVLKIADVDVISPSEELDIARMTQEKDKQLEPFPRIVYYNSTATTTTTLQNLAARKTKSLKTTCVIFDGIEGTDIVAGIEDASGYHIESICSAVIYDDLFRAIRGWLRAGYSPSEIQTELDTRFGYLWPVLTYRGPPRKTAS
mmetsp:Transcript_6020/g.23391  ORF Transcript_6020/g.23391 Transcript_6020/m.23391 type:complete len:709 (-) Transcript_6020:1204-3330(-)